MLRKLLVLAGLLFATAAQAEWREIRTAHFLVYGEDTEARLRQFAEKLEKFNYVLRTYHNTPAPNAPNRLRVFLLPSIGAVEGMAGSRGVAGYYVREARGQLLVGVLRIDASRHIDSENVLLHEYTHHFMFQYFPATYPAWYVEGFAEFWGETRFLANNVVEVGWPAEHRFESFQLGRWLPVDRLLSAQSYGDVPEIDLLYAEGWLLVRRTFDDRERRQQLQLYLNAINQGVPNRDAATRAFGNLGRLNSELYDYAGRGRFEVLRLPFRELPVGDVTVRTLRPAEQALIEYELRFSQGAISHREIADFARDVRSRAAAFPDDPFALGLLTEVERLAGNREAASTAAERWIRADPRSGRALMNQAFLRIEALGTAGATDAAAWNAARQLIVRANQLTPNDPLILEAYYDSYRAQRVVPPEPAQAALYTAMELAPGDDELRFKVAIDFEQRDMIPDAIAIIRPVAFRSSHANETERQRRRREALREWHRTAGDERHESAADMLARLQQRLAANPPAPTPTNPN